ncbi:hypothetical protein PL373_13760 [Tenacibaculum maritimum]|nr:hypothetical protein [Tenacibaculum maritimum]
MMISSFVSFVLWVIYSTLKIATKHPEKVLFTIHDSIVTTENYISIFESEFKTHLAEYFKTLPAIKIEYWDDESI